METRIVWLSRHLPTPRQREALDKLFPNGLELRVDTRPFKSADEALYRLRILKGDELVVVAPFSTIRAINERGIIPLWAEMVTTTADDPLAEVHTHGRHYRFIAFHRVEARLILHPITPTEEKNDSEDNR